jgi:hypothetical protein
MYGFNRLTRGKDHGGYFHEYSLRAKPFLTTLIVRIKVKGTGRKAASILDKPDYYALQPVGMCLSRTNRVCLPVRKSSCDTPVEAKLWKTAKDQESCTDLYKEATLSDIPSLAL